MRWAIIKYNIHYVNILVVVEFHLLHGFLHERVYSNQSDCDIQEPLYKNDYEIVGCLKSCIQGSQHKEPKIEESENLLEEILQERVPALSLLWSFLLDYWGA